MFTTHQRTLRSPSIRRCASTVLLGIAAFNSRELAAQGPEPEPCTATAEAWIKVQFSLANTYQLSLEARKKPDDVLLGLANVVTGSLGSTLLDEAVEKCPRALQALIAGRDPVFESVTEGLMYQLVTGGKENKETRDSMRSPSFRRWLEREVRVRRPPTE
jgi:hypothetical protein